MLKYFVNKYLYWIRFLKLFFLAKKHPQGTLILGYHQIGSLSKDPLSLTVSKSNFYDQLKFLKKKFTVINPQQFYQSIVNHTIIPNSILITFDDGYSNNLTQALPVLEKEKITALFFIATKNIIDQTPFWWDRMFSLRDYHEYKHKTLLFSQNNIKVSQTELPLTTGQLRILSSSLGAVIGAHTHSHPCLSNLTFRQQAKDIKMGLKLLKKFNKQPIHFFSYPFGGLVDYNSNTIKIVQNHFKLAFTAMPFVANYHFNRYELPRFFVGNYSGKKLGKIIKEKFPNHGK